MPVLLNKPNVYGSIFRFEATVFNYEGGPNYRDLYPEPLHQDGSLLQRAAY